MKMIGKNDLDREQRTFIYGDSRNGILPFYQRSGNEFIQGFPGSGKTLLMIYAVAQMLHYNPNTSILFVEYTRSLIAMIRAELNKLSYEGEPVNASNVKVVTRYQFFNSYANGHYDLIICDEVQDMTEKVISQMNMCAERVLVGGDENQSIFEDDVKWHEKTCSPQEISNCLEPRDTKLNIMHRLPKDVVKAIKSFMSNASFLDGRASMMTKNVKIRLWEAASMVEEVKWIMEPAMDAYNVNRRAGILFSTNDKIVEFCNFALQNAKKKTWTPTLDKYRKLDLETLNSHLEGQGLPLQCLGRGTGTLLENSGRPKITLMTYFSAKGLDFSIVFLPFCDSADMYSSIDDYARRVFLVAMSRSTSDLYITYTNEMNINVSKFKDQCQPRETVKIGAEDSTDIFGF